MTQVQCSICEKSFDLETSPAPPFCSQRCKQIDLGRWASEKYGLLIERSEEVDES